MFENGGDIGCADAVVEALFGQAAGAMSHGGGFIGVVSDERYGLFPRVDVGIGDVNGVLATCVGAEGEVGIAGADDGFGERHCLDDGGEADGVVGFEAADDDGLCLSDCMAEFVLEVSLGEMDVDVGTYVHVGEHLPVIDAAVVPVEIDVKVVVGACKGVDEGGHVAAFASCGDESAVEVEGAPEVYSCVVRLGNVVHEAVVEVQVGSPMAYMRVAGACLACCYRLVHELLGEENHLVDAFEEDASETIAPSLAGLYQGLVYPHDDLAAVKAQRAEEDQEFHTLIMCGENGVDVFAQGEDLPGCVEHTQEAVVMFAVSADDGVDAVLWKMSGAIEQVAWEGALFPLGVHPLGILCMIEKDTHNIGRKMSNAVQTYTINVRIEGPAGAYSPQRDEEEGRGVEFASAG